MTMFDAGSQTEQASRVKIRPLMFRLFEALKSEFALRLRKQKQRRRIYIASDLYIETFDYPSGNVQLYATVGGEISLSASLGVPDAKRLLRSLASAFEQTNTLTNVATSQANFYVKSGTKGVVLEVFLSSLPHTPTQSFKVSQAQIEEAFQTFLNL